MWARGPLVGLASGRIGRADRLPDPDDWAVAWGADELDAGGLELIRQGLNRVDVRLRQGDSPLQQLRKQELGISCPNNRSSTSRYRSGGDSPDRAAVVRA